MTLNGFIPQKPIFWPAYSAGLFLFARTSTAAPLARFLHCASGPETPGSTVT
jgi:hypothetical protein